MRCHGLFILAGAEPLVRAPSLPQCDELGILLHPACGMQDISGSPTFYSLIPPIHDELMAAPDSVPRTLRNTPPAKKRTTLFLKDSSLRLRLSILLCSLLSGFLWGIWSCLPRITASRPLYSFSERFVVIVAIRRTTCKNRDELGKARLITHMSIYALIRNERRGASCA